MNNKPETNPANSLDRVHRLGAYLAIFVAINWFIPAKNWFGDLVFIYILASGAVMVGLAIRINSISKELNYSGKGFLTSGDFLDEAIVTGIKYTWLAMLAFMGVLMVLTTATNFSLPSKTIIELSFLIIWAGPFVVYLLITRISDQEGDA